MSALSVAIMAGWVVLALGAWRARVLGLFRAVCLAAMSALPLGVLKGTTALSIVAVAGLTVALAPLGVRMLREGEKPGGRAVVGWTIVVIAAGCAMVILGTVG
jgi:hypothetical protein